MPGKLTINKILANNDNGQTKNLKSYFTLCKNRKDRPKKTNN